MTEINFTINFFFFEISRVQHGHRNLSLVLGEIAERNYKQQYGLLIADDLTDRYEPFLKQQEVDAQYECNTIHNTNSTSGSFSESSASNFQKSHSFSGIVTNKKRESLPEIGSSSFSRSINPIPSLTIRNCDAPENSSYKFEDILEEDEDENNVENVVDTTAIKAPVNVPAFTVPLVNVNGDDDDDVDNDDDDAISRDQTTYNPVLPFNED